MVQGLHSVHVFSQPAGVGHPRAVAGSDFGRYVACRKSVPNEWYPMIQYTAIVQCTMCHLPCSEVDEAMLIGRCSGAFYFIHGVSEGTVLKPPRASICCGFEDRLHDFWSLRCLLLLRFDARRLFRIHALERSAILLFLRPSRGIKQIPF